MTNDPMEAFMGSIHRRIGKGGQEAASQQGTSPTSLRETMRRMEDASCRGRVTGSCGETMEIQLRIQGETVQEATFVTDGCQFSIICGFLATQLSKGKTVDEVVQIGGDTILMSLKEVPESESHCAYLAAEALHAALHDWVLKG